MSLKKLHWPRIHFICTDDGHGLIAHPKGLSRHAKCLIKMQNGMGRAAGGGNFGAARRINPIPIVTMHAPHTRAPADVTVRKQMTKNRMTRSSWKVQQRSNYTFLLPNPPIFFSLLHLFFFCHNKIAWQWRRAWEQVAQNWVNCCFMASNFWTQGYDELLLNGYIPQEPCKS